MAKPTSKGGTSRVRFIMIEAEGPEGDLAQITQAIQNALRPPNSGTQRIVSVTNGSGTAGALAAPAVTGEIIEDANPDETEADQAPAKPKETKPRRPTVPKAHDFDAESVTSWKQFAAGIEVNADLDRYLMVAAWLHDHQNGEPVTANHVYSCYRHMKWPVSIADFGSQLRAAKGRQFLNSAERGAYTITQLGLQRVEELRGS